MIGHYSWSMLWAYRKLHSFRILYWLMWYIYAHLPSYSCFGATYHSFFTVVVQLLHSLTMRSIILAALASTASAMRWVVYYDQYHPSFPTDPSILRGVTHINIAFANSSLFTTNPVGEYTPFKPLSEIRALFDHDVKVCMAIGGWADTAGFGVGSKTAESRKLYARNVKATMDRLGYDCVGKIADTATDLVIRSFINSTAQILTGNTRVATVTIISSIRTLVKSTR